MSKENFLSETFCCVSSAQKHWRLCIFAGVLAFGISELTAGVIDEALIWWRGPHDANGDGRITAEEIFNARFPKEDVSHQGVTVYGNLTFSEKENAISPWNGLPASTASIRFEADTAYAASLNFPVSKTALRSGITAFTMHLRCKWDGEFGVDGGNRANLFAYGNAWNDRRGGSLSFVPVNNNAGGILRFDNGQNQYATEFEIKTNVWYDVFYRISDPYPAEDAAAHNVNIDAYFFKDRTLHSSTSCNSHWSSWRTPGADVTSSTTKYVSAELRTIDDIIVCQHFKGNIAQFGLWNKVLSIDEMREVAAWPSVFPDLIRIGDSDGRGDEFATGNSFADSAIVVPGGRLDKVPPVLTSVQPSISISFRENGIPVHANRESIDEITGYETLPQLLSVKTVAGSAVCSIDVVLDGKKISHCTISPDRPGQVYIKAMEVGEHTLTITRTGTADVHLDQIRMGGSWSLGDRFCEIPQKGNQYKGGFSPYLIHLDTPISNMCGSVMSSASTSATASFSFDMPPEMTGYAYRYDIGISQCSGNVPPRLILYVNGVEYGRFQVTQLWGSLKVDFPANTFVSGRNVIAWRFDADSHTPDYYTGIRSHVFILSSRPSRGTWLLIR